MKTTTLRTPKIALHATLDNVVVEMVIPKANALYIEEFLRQNTGKDIEVELRRVPKKRSQNANAYMWVLCDQIAKATGTDKETVYKEIIKRVGVFDYVLVKAHAADRFQANWADKGLGWFTQEIPYIKDRGVRQFIAYYGTSTYDTHQMARVIDEAVDEARQLDIETLPPEELVRIKEQWARVRVT